MKRQLQLAFLFMPTLALTPLLGLEFYFNGTQHFALHTLMGWDVALLGLLAASFFGFAASPWDGVPPLVLALWANMPDLLYLQGYYHRDWMDIYLFHVAIDEILFLALPVLFVLWVVLLLSYLRFRLPSVAPATN